MRHHYDECNLCHATDENQELKMFTYDTNRYIISQAAYTDDDDATHICIKCIRTIKEFDGGMVR